MNKRFEIGKTYVYKGTINVNSPTLYKCKLTIIKDLYNGYFECKLNIRQEFIDSSNKGVKDYRYPMKKSQYLDWKLDDCLLYPDE